MSKALEVNDIDQYAKSIGKLTNLLGNLELSDPNSFEGELAQLIYFMENDAFFSQLAERFKNNPDIDFSHWRKEFESSGGINGTCYFKPILDSYDQTSMLYQLLHNLNSGDMEIATFLLRRYGGTRYQDMIDNFSNDILRKFRQGLLEILEQVQDKLNAKAEEIRQEEEAKQTSKSFATSPTIQLSNIHGSQIALTGSTISYSNIQTFGPTELISAIDKLEEFLVDVPEVIKASTQQAIEVLKRSSRGASVDSQELFRSCRQRWAYGIE